MTIYLGVIVDDCVTHYVIAGRPGERERPPPPMVVLCREGGGGGEVEMEGREKRIISAYFSLPLNLIFLPCTECLHQLRMQFVHISSIGTLHM